VVCRAALQKESLKGTAGAFIEKGIFAVAADGHVALFGLKEGTPVATKAALNPAYVGLSAGGCSCCASSVGHILGFFFFFVS
jgi:hypothetical protein